MHKSPIKIKRNFDVWENRYVWVCYVEKKDRADFFRNSEPNWELWRKTRAYIVKLNGGSLLQQLEVGTRGIHLNNLHISTALQEKEDTKVNSNSKIKTLLVLLLGGFLGSLVSTFFFS